MRDHPTDPDAVLIDVLHGHWAAILRLHVEQVTADGLWSVTFQSSYPCPRIEQPINAVSWSKNRSVNLAAFVLEVAGQPRPTDGLYEPDHVNFDVLDNRLGNLRWLPKLENRRRKRALVAA